MAGFNALLRMAWRLSLILALCIIAAGIGNWLHPKRVAWPWMNPPAEEVASCLAPNSPLPSRITSEALWRAQSDYIIGDVRDLKDYNAGHIPGAIHLSCHQIKALAVNQNKKLLIYDNLESSVQLTQIATQAHNLKWSVSLLSGGWSAWVMSHLPIETLPCTQCSTSKEF